MEPLVALSAAGTIIQFVEFGSKLLSEGRAFYRSSALGVNEEIELIVVDLQALVAKLRHDYFQSGIIRPLTKTDQEDEVNFNNLCSGSAELAEEIIERLSKLRVGPSNGRIRKWESLKRAIQSAWTKEEIMGLVHRLHCFREGLNSRLLFFLRKNIEDHSLLLSARFDRIDQQSQQIIAILLENSEVHPKVNYSPQERDSSTDITTITQALTQLVNRLDTLDDYHRTRDLMFAKSHSLLTDFNDQRAIKGIGLLSVSDDEEMALRKSIQTKILETLHFSMISSRYDKVGEAYPDTFKWIFQNTSGQSFPWSNFTEWLTMDTNYGVYWVSGKAGSGKTTLMKHIFDAPQTQQMLSKWAKGTPLCVASFFFWGSGTEDQKSQEGLLRALIFQILSREPRLIPIVLPDLWSRMYSDHLESDVKITTRSMSVRQLMSWFKNLLRQTSFPLKMFFLVDGLDEFNGDHDEIADLFKDLEGYHNIKICISSRPWQVFEDVFAASSMLRLHNLTRADIQHFVTDRFARNSSFCKLTDREPRYPPILIHEIVDRADGVFLWVRIVVKTLLNGIQQRDDISTLLMKLRALPRDLEPLYEHFLNSIDQVDLPWASSAFQIFRAAYGVLANGLKMKLFYLAIHRHIDPRSIQGLENEYRTCEDTAVQLKARCAGMLETTNPSSRPDGKLAEAKIVCIHDTASSFLGRDAKWDHMVSHTANTGFDPYFSLLKAVVIALEIRHQSKEFTSKDFSYLCEEAKHALSFASRSKLDAAANRKQTMILNHLGKLMSWYSPHSFHWGNNLFDPGLGGKTHRESRANITSFLELATLYNLTGYVTEILSKRKRSEVDTYASSLLHMRLSWPLPSRTAPLPTSMPFPGIDMITTLLGFGADPNFNKSMHTAWEILLHDIATPNHQNNHILLDHHDDLHIPYVIPVMRALIKGGADPRVRICGNGTSYSVLRIVVEYVSPKWPNEASEIMKELVFVLEPEEYDQFWDELGIGKQYDSEPD